MKVFERRAFASFYDQDSGAAFADIEFHRCRFESCAVGMSRDPGRRTTIRNVKLVNCERRGCTLYAAIVEETVVDGLKTHGLFQAWGAVYSHVTLRGKLGRIMSSPAVAGGKASAAEQGAFDEANAAHYADVDWALDITEAEFEEGEFRGVPAKLVRRDPATQVVVTREKAMRGEWRRLDLSKTHWATSLEFFLERGDQDVVLVAPKRNRKFRQLLDGLTMLRDAGVAEPD